MNEERTEGDDNKAEVGYEIFGQFQRVTVLQDERVVRGAVKAYIKDKDSYEIVLDGRDPNKPIVVPAADTSRLEEQNDVIITNALKQATIGDYIKKSTGHVLRVVQSQHENALSGDTSSKGRRKFNWMHKLSEVERERFVRGAPWDSRVNADPSPCVLNIIHGFERSQEQTVHENDLVFIASAGYDVGKGVVCLPVYKLDVSSRHPDQEAILCALMSVYYKQISNYSSKVVRVNRVVNCGTVGEEKEFKTAKRLHTVSPETFQAFGWFAEVNFSLTQSVTDMSRSSQLENILHKKIYPSDGSAKRQGASFSSKKAVKKAKNN